jgi:hypothetical protein
MYDALKSIVFPLLKLEESEPTPPTGSHDSFQVFRACPAFLSYKLFFWKLYAAIVTLTVAVVSAALLAFNRWFIMLIVPSWCSPRSRSRFSM